MPENEDLKNLRKFIEYELECIDNNPYRDTDFLKGMYHAYTIILRRTKQYVIDNNYKGF